MTMRLRLMTALVTLALGCGASTTAHAQQPDLCDWTDWHSQPQGVWFDGDVHVNILRNTIPSRYNADRVRRRIMAGARGWARVRTKCRIRHGSTSVRFVYGGPDGNSATNFGDNSSSVEFLGPATNSDGDPYLLDPRNCVGAGIIACEHTQPAGGAGTEPVATDIAFNEDKNWWVRSRRPPIDDDVVRYDLMSVALHEFGHSYGIGHTIPGSQASSSDPTAAKSQVMYPSIGDEQHKRYLGRSDVQALCSDYC